MQMGMIGLGRMGGNMVRRLREGGHEIVGFDMNPESDRNVDSLEQLVATRITPTTPVTPTSLTSMESTFWMQACPAACGVRNAATR